VQTRGRVLATLHVVAKQVRSCVRLARAKEFDCSCQRQNRSLPELVVMPKNHEMKVCRNPAGMFRPSTRN